jgi:hypothetical protein
MKKSFYVLFLSILIAACAPTYQVVKPGTANYDGFKVTTAQSWNLAPTGVTPSVREGTRVWTQDGILLDRVMIIPAVPDGESIFVSKSDKTIPIFRSDMLPNEVEELTESSIVKLFTEGEVAVETSNLRPHRFGENNGFLFDMNVSVSDGPNYLGVAGALIVDKKLYLIFFLGAEPYYYEKHIDEALVVIKGARV